MQPKKCVETGALKVNHHALNLKRFQGVASYDDWKATIHYDKLSEKK